jgi:hypothetical protein
LSPEKFVKKASAVALFLLVEKFQDLQGTLLESDMQPIVTFQTGLVQTLEIS